jgi:hypothetical protein
MTRNFVEASREGKEKKKEKRKNIEGVDCFRNFVGVFAEHPQRVAEVSSCISDCLSAWNSSAHIGRSFVKCLRIFTEICGPNSRLVSVTKQAQYLYECPFQCVIYPGLGVSTQSACGSKCDMTPFGCDFPAG